MWMGAPFVTKSVNLRGLLHRTMNDCDSVDEEAFFLVSPVKSRVHMINYE